MARLHLRSLSVKLLLAFALVALLAIGTVALVVQQVTAHQFTLYISRGGQMRAEAWAQAVAEYYARLSDAERTDPWAGLDAVFEGEGTAYVPGSGRGMGRGQSWGRPQAAAPAEERVLVVSPDGRVAFDTDEDLLGQPVPPNVQEQGAPIVVDGKTVGTLLVTTADLSGYSTWEREFIDAVNRAILGAALLVCLASLTMAVLFSRQLVAPVLRLTAAAERLAAGDLTQRVTVHSRDEIGELGRAFNKMANDLQTAEVQRRQMTADIAHELRNPLSVIRGNLEAMLDGIYALDARHLQPVYKETMLLQRLVEDLRLLSLADAGQLALVRSDIDIRALLEGVVSSAQAVAQDRGLSIELDLSPDDMVIVGDEGRLRQVLGNLLSNAIRHTPPGGRIALRARRREQWIEIVVTDTGSGIAPEDLPYVFDRFYRGEPARDRASGGSGLGLAIARALVEAHSGTIQVQSQPGAGTMFTISLPTTHPPGKD